MKRVTIDEYTDILRSVVSRSQRKRLIFQLEQAVSKTEIKDKIIDFFKENPDPNDSQIHEYAEKTLGLDPDKLETIIYEILTDYMKIGNVKNKPDSDFDPEQLRMGELVEREHMPEDTPFYRNIAKSIAKDHLEEIKNYYSELKIMEDNAKKE